VFAAQGGKTRKRFPAIISHPGALSRRGEVSAVRDQKMTTAVSWKYDLRGTLMNNVIYD
jgi:hypothetical protein